MKQVGVNQALQLQQNELHEILKLNQSLYDIILEMSQFGLTDYYIGGGSIAQTVWNYLLEKPLDFGISDVDIVYFEPDLSAEKEAVQIEAIQAHFCESSYQIDVANEARVHLWYHQAFGKQITAYQTVEEAISTWPTTATSIGVRLEQNDYSFLLHMGSMIYLKALFGLIKK